MKKNELKPQFNFTMSMERQISTSHVQLQSDTSTYGVDYKEVFAPVARQFTIRLIISIATQKPWHIHQLDVKSAFLHGKPQKEVDVEQRDGFVQKGRKDKVYKLKKAL